jgi:ACS family tartrate transporter-like MFS transporter
MCFIEAPHAPNRILPNPESGALKKVGRRLIPYLGLLYFAAFIDRVNVGFAAAQMNRDLGFSAYVYGLGAGIFFIGYALFEVPSNLILHRIGGRRWLARIMLTWGVIAGAMAFIKGATGFYILRFLLGVAEAGFFPGVIYYLTYWVPAAERARLIGTFMTAIPISTALGGPLSSAILGLDGMLGMAGWQWLFLTETVPSLLLGLITLHWLPDTPAHARWLTVEEREWLTATLDVERSAQGKPQSLVRTLVSARVLALSLCYFGVVFGMYGVILWVPQILLHAGVAPAHVGAAVAVPYTVGAVAMVWWSRRSDRLQERVRHIAAASAAGFAGLAGSAAFVDSPLLSIAAISIGAAGGLAVVPIFWTLPASLLSGAAAAGAIALINAIGNVGGFAGPFMIGWIKDATGSFSGGLLAVACSVLATGAAAVVIGNAPRGKSANKSVERAA